MKNTALSAAFACTAAAALLSGCGGSAPTADAPIASTDSARIHAVTRIDGLDLSELSSRTSPDTTCFTLTSQFTSSSSPATIECVRGLPLATNATPTANATLLRKLGSSNYYHVTPASRPDVSCHILTSIYSSSSKGGGGISCSIKPSP